MYSRNNQQTFEILLIFEQHMLAKIAGITLSHFNSFDDVYTSEHVNQISKGQSEKLCDCLHNGEITFAVA